MLVALLVDNLVLAYSTVISNGKSIKHDIRGLLITNYLVYNSHSCRPPAETELQL